ncbi:unnamed protein product [Schistosoma mattheei]|uniref:Uncharacterized protein n=1 Tax=Schistosoma mattheei TaxID=31246 RepID=A0A183Q493_9TREM|nr:unnamed protein product [Schistosoma mattheei]
MSGALTGFQIYGAHRHQCPEETNGDPILFSGTLRFNLDPFNHYTDEAIWHALELANLKSFIKDANNNNDANYGLDMNISEGGSNIRLVSVFGFFC